MAAAGLCTIIGLCINIFTLWWMTKNDPYKGGNIVVAYIQIAMLIVGFVWMIIGLHLMIRAT